MLENPKCPICKRTSSEPLNLKCEHHPCFVCLQPYVTIDSENKIETKYKINCPTCKKKTVFYDLRHLIITQTLQDEEDLYVTTKYVETKNRKCSEIEKRNQKSSQKDIGSFMNSKRCSIQSIANEVQRTFETQIKCLEHNQNYKYFCSDCSDPTKKCLLCPECSKQHYSAKHKLLTLKHGQEKLIWINNIHRQQIQYKIEDTEYNKGVLQHHETLIMQQYSQMEEYINGEFRKIYDCLSKKYQAIQKDLKNRFDDCIERITYFNTNLENKHSQLLKLVELDGKDLESNIYFYQLFQKLTKNQIDTKFDLQSLKMPKVLNKIDNFQILIQEWIAVGDNKRQKTTSKKTRKSSLVQDDYSCRSIKEKQNMRIGTPSAHIQLNLKKIF